MHRGTGKRQRYPDDKEGAPVGTARSIDLVEIKADDQPADASAVMAGMGVALVPRCLVEDKIAAGLVSENDLVFFDNGSEMPLVINMIPDDIIFTGICYSHRVFMALNEKPNATAILCGGTYRAKSDAFYDTGNPSALDSLNPRKVFISASGVHEHFGVSWFNPDDLATKRKAMDRGLRKILLARYALFDDVAPASIAPLPAFDVLISDRPLPADYATHCRNGSVKVITPDSESE